MNMQWTGQKPTAPGAYRIRGFNLDHEPDDQLEALVDVALDEAGELRCSLHRSTTDDLISQWYKVEVLSDQFEWKRIDLAALEIPDNEDTRFILGHICFRCVSLAKMLRAEGVEIAPKAEAEQAAVIRWMLNLYLLHRERWHAEALDFVDAHKARLAAADTSSAGGAG